MKIAIKAGFDISFPGPPTQQILAANVIRTVGLLGADTPGMRVELLVSEGEEVAVGTPLFRDRRRPRLCFTAPVSGTVRGIDIGEKRLLTSLMIAREGDDRKRFDVSKRDDRVRMQALLLESGLWPSFTSRPFGRIPDPGSSPDAIFVTAVDTQPLAADARVVLSGSEDEFSRGIAALKLLGDGSIFVCQGPGPHWVQDDGRISCVEVTGLHPAGLAGTHISRLFPLTNRRTVWQINYQDVIAIGTLLRAGELSGERVIALAGPGIRQPRLVRIAQGSDLDDLVEGELTEGAKQIVSGPPLGGRLSRFLGRHHWQVTALSRPDTPTRKSWLGRHLRPQKPLPIVATAALERALAIDIPVAQLLRALSVGDAETADRLGCRELLEEDMALVNYASGGTQDFASLLRATLDVLEPS